MRIFCSLLFVASAFAAENPFVGRWGFNMPSNRASWLGITENNSQLEVWYQPTGGNVYQVKEVKEAGSRLSLTVVAANDRRPAVIWELEVSGDSMKGQQVRAGVSTQLAGIRAPKLDRPVPKNWTKAEPLFNGRDLTGWEPMGDAKNSHWIVKDSLLVNEDHGANLRTTRKFNDFKLHFEVLCPDHANSGFYLRGRYEVQLEYEPLSANPPERRIGSVYGRIAPEGDLKRQPGEWETFDITLVGRHVTVVRNGVTTINNKEIVGITGGALDANEAEPGPFYVQGDHTGGLKFRNITISVPATR
jgi:hypothetical protein